MIADRDSVFISHDGQVYIMSSIKERQRASMNPLQFEKESMYECAIQMGGAPREVDAESSLVLVLIKLSSEDDPGRLWGTDP